MEGESLSYWSATGTSGELPIYNAPNISVSDLSKTFDGVPITTNDALKSVTTASNGAVHVQLQEYSTKKENYGWNDIDQALKAGDYSNDASGEHYRVVVTTDATSSYAPGSYTQEFRINKRPTTTSIASIDAVMSNGTLSGWNITAQVSGFVSGYTGGSVTLYDTTNGANTALVSADVPDSGKVTLFVDASAIANPSACVIKASYGGDAYYYSGSEKSFATLPTLPTISVPDLTKTYDGVAITAATARPQISTNAESGVTVRIQQRAGDSWQDVSSAENAGHYRVLAETQASAAYVAGSASQEFDILQAPTATSVSGVSETSGGVVTGWTVTAKVAGLVSGHAAGTVTFYSTASGTDLQLGSPVSVSADGTASATISADGVSSGVYTIKAVYSGAANYADSEGSLTASLSLRGISGTASYDKTVGDASFKLDMTTGAPTSTDVWTYRVAEDSFTNFTREDGSKAETTVTVSDDGQVSINHAGTAFIEVTLSDTSGTYADQTVYVTVTVGKASLVVEPYAYGEDPETPIGGGLASFDTEATVFQEDPTLAIDAAVTGSSDFRSLSVKRNADGSVASYESAVYATGGSAANYEVTFTRGNLTVEPESLADAARIIASADATAFTYNGSTQVPASFSVTDGGSELAENTDYTVSLPDSSTDAGDYVVTLTGAGNYTGTVTVAYTIAKASLSVITPGASKVYDGTAPTKADGATLQGLVGNETATVIGTGSQVDAGSSSNGYGIVWDGTAKESNYTVASESLGTLTVSRRTLTIETSSATKVYDGTPLTAPGTVRGLADGDTVTFVTTGSQTDPGSSKNSYTLDWDGTAKFTNYDVWENLGTLTVTQTADQIVVTTTGGTFEYDGRPHGASVTVSQLPAGLRVVEAESSATATHVSDGEVKATADKLKIINELGGGRHRQAQHHVCGWHNLDCPAPTLRLHRGWNQAL
jgi:hypothetical protein